MDIATKSFMGHTIVALQETADPLLAAYNNVLIATENLEDLLAVQERLPGHVNLDSLIQIPLRRPRRTGQATIVSRKGAYHVSLETGTVTQAPTLPLTYVDDSYQIGVIHKKSARVAYPSDVVQRHPYLSRNRFVDKSHHDALVKRCASGGPLLYVALHNFMNPAYDFDNIAFAWGRQMVARVLTPRKTQEDNPLKRLQAYMHERSTHTDLICQTTSRDNEERRHLASEMQRTLQEPTYAYTHIPYIVMRIPKHDAQRIVDMQHQGQLFKRKHAKHLYGVQHAQYRFIPELLTEVTPALEKLLRKLKKSTPWHLPLIGIPQAQRYANGNGVKVCVCDTGADVNHHEIHHLFGSTKGYNFVNNNTNIADGNGHGTHVSGLIGGKNVGAAPGVTVYAAKVLSDRGFGSEASVVKGLEWAIDHGMDLVNMSLGSMSRSNFEADAIAAVLHHGIGVYAAAGNEGYGPSYPAAYPGVVSVAAVHRNKRHADFSNIDPSVDISAPGVEIYSCLPGNNYEAWSGTSMATPLACGSAALVLSKRGYDPEALQQVLYQHAEHLGRGNERSKYGAGLIRPDHIVSQLHLPYEVRYEPIRT